MAFYTPAEGRDYIQEVSMRNGIQYPTWYVALFEGDYTPQDDDTAANFAIRATECTAYTIGTRLEVTFSPSVGGDINNESHLGSFTLTATKTIRGFAILSAPAKGATTGVLRGIEKLTSPRTYAAGDVVKVPVHLTLMNQ